MDLLINYIFSFNKIGDRLEPKIENYKKKYELGEKVNLRCVSSHYQPMPQLYWLIDGVPVDAQYLDYKEKDFSKNGIVRLDLNFIAGKSLTGGQVVRKSLFNRSIDSYNLRCVQELSEVISEANEMAELWLRKSVEMHNNPLDGNSVEAGMCSANGYTSAFTVV